MKIAKNLATIVLTVALAGVPFLGLSADGKNAETAKLRPYTLKTCIVSDEKLGEMGKEYVFGYEGQEIKLCCKGCLKDFKKDPAKYIKKMKEAEEKAKAKEKEKIAEKK
jgi:hypothetical protein